jgi:hypothetical protein
MGKVKVKVTLEQATMPQRESRGIALLVFLTSALDAVGCQLHAPATLPSGKTRYPLYRCAPGPVWTGAENLATTEIWFPDRPANSKSLYRLRYPGPNGL